MEDPNLCGGSAKRDTVSQKDGRRTTVENHVQPIGLDFVDRLMRLLFAFLLCERLVE
jgi:hypothetical protein